MKKGNKSDTSSLRQKAEELLKNRKTRSVTKFLEADTLKLIHELEVHQVELELQNEELLSAIANSETANEKYLKLYDSTPSGYFTLSREGTIMQLNLKGAEMIGKERGRLVNSTFGFFVSDNTKKDFSLFLKKVFGSKEKEICEIVLMRNDQIPVEIVLTGIAEDERCCMVTAIIYSEIRNLERDLIFKEERLKLAIQSAGFGTYAFNFQNGHPFYSKEFLNIYGLNENETIELDPDMVPKAIQPEDKDYFLTSMNHANDPRGTGVLNIEFRIIHKDGIIRWLRTKGLTVFSGNSVSDKPLYANGIIQDITLQKETEETLRKSEAEFRSLFENSLVAISQVLPDGNFLRVNHAYAEMYGYPDPQAMLADLTKVSTKFYSNPGDRKKVMDILYEKGFMNPTEFELNRRNGEKFWVLVAAKKVTDNTGNLLYIQAEHIDITQRKKVESDLLESERKFRSLFTSMNEGFALHEIICDDKGTPKDYRFLEVNSSFENLTGLKAKDIIGKTYLQVLPGSEPFWVDTYGKVALTGKSLNFENYSRELNKYYQVSAYSPEPGKFATIFMDITERKRVDEELRVSRGQYKILTENIKDVVWVMDAETMYFRYISPSVERLRGFTPEEVMADPVTKALTSESAEFVINLTRSRVEATLSGKSTPDDFYTEEIEQPCKNGSLIWTEVITNLYVNPENGRVEVRGVTRDISERKHAEETLRLEKENFRHSLDDSPLGVRIVSGKGKTIYVNQTLLDIYGFDSLEEMQKVPLENRYTQESFAEAKKRKIARVNGNLIATNYDVSIIKKNGEIHHLKGYSKKVLWDGVWQFQIIYEDITEIKTREIELENSREQLEQLNLYLQRIREEERKLISRELHDELGQSLTAIKIDLGILKNNLSNQSKVSQKIEKITALLNDSIISVQRLTSELRPHILDDLGLVAAIDWYTDEYIKRTGTTINLNIDKNISLPNEIELVIFRILQESLTNIARHSKAENAEIIFYRQHSDVILEIKDDGIGISSIDRKSPKSLGLLNMSERAREIGGKFIIESRKKQGTRICLTVPDILFEE